MQAIIKTGGKQYLVKPNQILKIEKISNAKKGDIITFDKVLLTFDDKVLTIGTPYVENAKVEAEVLEAKRDRKVLVRKYKSKTRYHKTFGHRQPFLRVKIKNIIA
ncbi:MAG TPA: 50S ribosomal protein L21 [Candidatus Paceibacterota bacterium]|jgi:large subunit ribosomal protein L21|nr:50S ribosomal protein L21 [Candidatus Paceibacterota bacterium]